MQKAILDAVYTIPSNECQSISNVELNSERISAFKPLKKNQSCQSINNNNSSSPCYSYNNNYNYNLVRPETHHLQPYSYSENQLHYNNFEADLYATTSNATIQQQQYDTVADEISYISHIENLYTRSRPISHGN